MATIATLIALVYGVAAAHGSFSFQNCGDNSPITLSITRFPEPLLLRSGHNITITAAVKNERLLPDRLKIKLGLKKKVLFWIPIPCISNIGSCQYEVSCEQVPALCVARHYCPSCQLAAHDFVIPLPKEVDNKVPAFLVNGHYQVKAEIMNGHTDETIACVVLQLELQK